MTASDTTTTQGELEKLVSDLRGLLASRDLDSFPEIKVLRQRIDDGMHARPRTQPSRPTVTPTTSHGASPARRWPWALWWAFCLRGADRLPSIPLTQERNV